MPPDGVIVIHAALLAAVQAQPAPAVTPTLPLPPEADTDALAGDIEYVHVGLIVIVRVRYPNSTHVGLICCATRAADPSASCV